jgi:hypothetical protein
MVVVGILLCKSLVWLDDGDELSFRVFRECAEESLDVTVNEADDDDADGCLWACRLRPCRKSCGEDAKSDKYAESFHQLSQM